jgi:hypothetical protein
VYTNPVGFNVAVFPSIVNPTGAVLAGVVVDAVMVVAVATTLD